MTLYLDSSSLVKLYVDEPDSSSVAQLCGTASVVATSVIAYAEVRAALARKRRERNLTPRELAEVRSQFDTDWDTLVVLNLDGTMARRAGAIAESHALRGADAIHLAAFDRLVAIADDDDVWFSSADDTLTHAAKRLG